MKIKYENCIYLYKYKYGRYDKQGSENVVINYVQELVCVLWILSSPCLLLFSMADINFFMDK